MLILIGFVIVFFLFTFDVVFFLFFFVFEFDDILKTSLIIFGSRPQGVAFVFMGKLRGVFFRIDQEDSFVFVFASANNRFAQEF